jgi:hypothetical protein
MFKDSKTQPHEFIPIKLATSFCPWIRWADSKVHAEK